ncbi:MAG: SDR family NAD(P)-dependent oxidoreductase [Reyranella sp.]|nr:SDR family NAD(P)-dependent oxidoreductase [Reyranella sp.]
MSSSHHLVTGATSGIGLELARLLLADPANRLVVGARRPEAAAALRALAGPERLAILPLDLASLATTEAFAGQVGRYLAGQRLASLAANAGLQIAGPHRLTADGYEETFQANFLGHAVLIERLRGHLAPAAPVVLTASGTHDPAAKTARLFGFRGGLFVGAERVARGELDPAASPKQLGLDRYATSKLCAILYVHGMARRAATAGTAADGPRFIAFDPGLMPGTGLARERSAVERWAWSTVLPVLARALPGTSTTRRSALAYARLLTGRAFAAGSGLHVDFTLAETPGSRDSRRADWQDELLRFVDRAALER